MSIILIKKLINILCKGAVAIRKFYINFHYCYSALFFKAKYEGGEKIGNVQVLL